MKNKQSVSSSSKSERVKVYIRVRPFNDDENQRGGETPFTNLDVENGIVSIKKEYDVKDYTYDGLYDMNSKQDDIFNNSAKPVIDVNIYFLILIYIVCIKRIQWDYFRLWANRLRKDIYNGRGFQ